MRLITIACATVLLLAGFLDAQPPRKQQLVLFGNTAIPGESLGTLRLGFRIEEVDAPSSPIYAQDPITGAVWPYQWTIPSHFGQVEFWTPTGVLAGFCRAGGRAFFVGGARLRDTVRTAPSVNAAIWGFRLPEGFGLGAGEAGFSKVFGPPVFTLSDLGSKGGAMQLYGSENEGIAIGLMALSKAPFIIGVYNFTICQGGQVDQRPYYPFLGRGVRVGPVFFSSRGDEAKSEIGDPILVAEPIPKFNAKQPIYVGVDVTTAKWSVGHEVPFSRQWSCADGPLVKWNFKKTIQQGEGGEGTVRLVAGINVRDRRPGICTLQFVVGPDTKLASAQFVLE